MTAAWASLRAERQDPYVAVQEFVSQSGQGNEWWPYYIIADQLQSGWDDAVRGAVALNLTQSSILSRHALIAFVLLSGRWSGNVTTSLNLLSLAHRTLSINGPLAKFVSRATLHCLRKGLGDSTPIVAEEAVNILGGLSAHHFVAATRNEVTELRRLANRVLQNVDDAELVDMLRSRIDLVLNEATPAAVKMDAADARGLLASLEDTWESVTRAVGRDQSQALRTHVGALAWGDYNSDPSFMRALESCEEESE